MDYYSNLKCLRLSDAIVGTLDFFPKNSVIVVRSIDSSRSKKAIKEIMQSNGIEYQLLTENVCLSRKSLEHIISIGVFNGFDEIWVFEDITPLEDLSPLPNCTSDSKNFGKNIDPKILEAFHKTQCFTVLADGCGLNFLTAAHNFAEKLIGLNKLGEEGGK